MRSVLLWRILALSILCAVSACGYAATECRVLDAELQGRYDGGCVNGLAEGYGEARGTAIYNGQFKAGRKHGKGVKSWPASGDHYEGDFIEDRKEGSGMYVWGRRSPFAGERYIGGYRADLRDGYGVYEWPNGERYAGPWEHDAIAGIPPAGMIARSRVRAELAAGVGRPGAKVCREMRVGIATEDRVRATVLAREGDNVRVRIDDPGMFDYIIGERKIAKGDVIVDPIRFWTPCT